MNVFEICIDSAEGAITAEEAGADRVELCTGLFDGGLTPSIGTVEATLRTVRRIRVQVLIRPRPGDFIYSPLEIETMVRDVRAVMAAGAHGIVIGALTPEGDIDVPTTRRLIEAAGEANITFHRAFDMARHPFAALEQLIDLGVHRVLTSGQESSALEGTPLIAELLRKAGDRIAIMPGGGITPRNIARIIAETGAKEYHFTARATSDSPAIHRNPVPTMGGALRRSEYERSATSGPLISQILAAARR
ncbi:MAG TPA: copper homeostasis protein CutC [Micromonospora sp.]|nr:copper homeostasis protein CutC [Micromonospora sp.]